MAVPLFFVLAGVIASVVVSDFSVFISVLICATLWGDKLLTSSLNL